MPIGTMIIRSPKEDIWSKPPTDIGPGQYNIKLPPFKSKYGLAPIFSTAERRTCEVTSTTPGPGTYNTNESSIKLSDKMSQPFASKSDRMEGERQLLKNIDLPGPGAYETSVVTDISAKHIASPYFCPRIGTNWTRVTTVPSIPSSTVNRSFDSKGRVIQQLCPTSTLGIPGPGAYNATIDFVKSHGKIKMSFGKPPEEKSLREGNPGPGAYDPFDKIDKSIFLKGGVASNNQLSMFASKSRRSKVGKDTFGPGPGTFPFKSSFQSKQEYLAANPDSYSAFGSCNKETRSDYPKNDIPGPGTYYNEDSSITKFHSKDVTGPFVSKAIRFPEYSSNSAGPGFYSGSTGGFMQNFNKKATNKFGVFGTTSPRFNMQHDENIPPVGSYDVKYDFNPSEARRGDQRMSAFRSTSKRSVTLEKTDKPLCYDYNLSWPKSKSTSKGFYINAQRFDSNLDSFAPGPGAYDGKIYDPMNAHTFYKDIRFHIPLNANVPGPGSYETRPSLLKKTFNVTIGNPTM